MKRISFILVMALLLISGCGETGHPSGGELTVTFLDVGQADAALVECGGKTMLIDGGNPSDSDLIYTVLKNRGITHLDYIVATHAHADHAGGLAGALSYASAGVVLSPVTEYNSRTFDNFMKALAHQGIAVTAPTPGDVYKLGEAEFVILGPAGIVPEDPNNSSIVLKITYGDTSFLFTGDAERKAEQEMLDAGYDLSATVLKVGHHGSDSSTTYPFLREIMPQYAVISCGKDNSYGHPHENLLSRLRDADVTLYRTDMQGDIICVSDGRTVTVTAGRNAYVQTNPTQPSPSVEEETYIGNINSQKFHRPACISLPAEQNRVLFDTRDAALDSGYAPCGNCKP